MRRPDKSRKIPVGEAESPRSQKAKLEPLKSHITERKKAEKELENVFNLSPNMICICTPEGEFLKVSPSCERILGYTVDEILKLGWANLVHPDDVEYTDKEVERQLKGSPVANFINRFRCKDGAYKTLEWQATPSVRGIVYATARDITERKQAGQKIQDYKTKLKAMASETLLIEERERQKIAAGLHDNVGQKLALAKFDLQSSMGSI